MAPTAMVNVVPARGNISGLCFPLASPAATKRKAEEDDTIKDDPTKRQKTESVQETSRKPTKTPRLAKSSTPTPRPLGTAANTIIVAQTVPQQTQSTVSAPSSSAASTTTTSQGNTQLASVTTSQVADATSTRAVFLSAPSYNLSAFLSQCPVNWTNIPGLKREHTEAYELRTLWNPVPVTFEAVAQQAQQVKGRVPSEECVRKRFKKACLAVFKQSGVCFEETALGLEGYGVPKQKELKGLIEAATKTVPSLTTRTVATSTATSSPLVEQQIEKTRFYRSSGCHRETSIYQGEVVAVQLQPCSTDNNNNPALRVCAKQLIHDPKLLNDYSVSTADDEICMQPRVPALPFSPAAFDRWHSSVCFGRRHAFPSRITLCKEISDGVYQLRDGGMQHSAVGLLIETYCLSQYMRTTDASDMMLDAIMHSLTSTPFSGFRTRDIALLQERLEAGDKLLVAVRDFLRQTVESLRCEEDGDSDGGSRADGECGEVAVDLTDPATVCGMYHNHAEAQSCYRMKKESSLLFPDLMDWKVPKEKDEEERWSESV